MQRCTITLGREFCTGGRGIAEEAAKRLGLRFYDRELITLAAQKSGFSEEAVEAGEKQHTHSLLYNLYTMGNDLPLNDQVFIMQSRIIRELAAQGPCVILGRCGDYVLREQPNVVRVFVYAPEDFRVRYAMNSPDFRDKTEKDIREAIAKTDKRRAAYYNYYTQNRWGDAHSYDLALNAELGRDACVDIILRAVQAREASL